MDLLVSASFIASFFAGVAALFAPCCITVLLPTYFASIFKQKATVFLMTFIYFLGLLVVFLPLGLGFGSLSQVFGQYHDQIFLAGSVFLIILGLSLLAGIHFSLPYSAGPSNLQKTGLVPIFFLGIFSGLATVCCAPVLAGVLTLSVLPGSFILGGIYTLAYVLGMVVPLFVIASFLDKIDFTHKFFVFRKSVNYNLLGKKMSLTAANLFAGLMFLILGGLILYLALTGRLTSHSAYQMNVNIYLTKFLNSIENLVQFIPNIAWGILFVVILLIIVKLSLKQLKQLKRKNKNED